MPQVQVFQKQVSKQALHARTSVVDAPFVSLKEEIAENVIQQIVDVERQVTTPVVVDAGVVNLGRPVDVPQVKAAQANPSPGGSWLVIPCGLLAALRG